MPVRYTDVVTKIKKGRNFGFIEVIDDNTSFVYDNDIYFHSSYLMEDYIAQVGDMVSFFILYNDKQKPVATHVKKCIRPIESDSKNLS